MRSLLAALLICFIVSPSAWALQLDRKGNLKDKNTRTEQAICLAGGGGDDYFADAWKYLLKKSGGGDVVVICNPDLCSGYLDWLYRDSGKNGFPRINSVTRITIANAEDANRPEVEEAIRNAEFVFFGGGDQSIYIDSFRGSKLLSAVEYVMKEKKAPVAGTSAGMALLAGIDFTSKYDSPTERFVTSADAMNDPMAKFVDLDRSVLVAPYLEQVITETHFSKRRREGRLMSSMARAVSNGYPGIDHSSIKGIAADDATAICYDGSGVARVFGEGRAFFLKGNAPIERAGVQDQRNASSGEASCDRPEPVPALPGIQPLLQPKSLDWYADGQAVKTYVISARSKASFNLKTWTGQGGTEEFWYVDGSVPGAPRFGVNRDKRGLQRRPEQP